MAILTPTQANKLGSVGTSLNVIEDPTTIASAATIAPTCKNTVVSGTTEITTITLSGTDFQGSINLIPTGAFTGATGGNIGKAFTAVAGKTLTMTYLQSTGLWYPSYTS